MMNTVEDCSLEIENDYNEEELKEWDKLKVLEYLMEYLELKQKALKKQQK